MKIEHNKKKIEKRMEIGRKWMGEVMKQIATIYSKQLLTATTNH
jgi:hypothetical protein